MLQKYPEPVLYDISLLLQHKKGEVALLPLFLKSIYKYMDEEILRVDMADQIL
jgi:hypothetical protein